MRTIHVNKRAAAAVISTLFLSSLLIFYSFSPKGNSTPSLGHKVLLARDINARINLDLEKLDLNEVEEKEEEDVGRQIPPAEMKPEELEKLSQEKVKVETSNVDDDAYRSNFVRNMMLHAWNGYRKYAWGRNEVKPIAKASHSQGIFGGSSSHLGATIVDALDTLLLMNLMDEYNQGREFVKNDFNISGTRGTISVFETNIRFLGGFLSAYALTNDTLYLDVSKDVANLLLKAFNTEYGIPKSTIMVETGLISNYGWANEASSILSEIGSLHLEFVYLSYLTGNPIYEEKVQKVRDHLDKIEKVEGMYPNYISPSTGRWTGKHVSLGAMGDSFYEYLIKSYIQQNSTQAWRMYNDTIEVILQKLLQKSKGGLIYIAEWRNGVLEHKMGHLACFCVGMFALQSHLEPDLSRKERLINVAEELGRTCHESYIRSSTQIGPEMFYFTAGKEAQTESVDTGYILRPEVIEGWFYLWRLTDKPMYKEWVWNAVQAIEKYCKKEGGYAGLLNVYNPNDGWDDVQQSFFLSETLKYAYLTFKDKSVISFDDWVFNTEAHPLPILTGKNS